MRRTPLDCRDKLHPENHVVSCSVDHGCMEFHHAQLVCSSSQREFEIILGDAQRHLDRSAGGNELYSLLERLRVYLHRSSEFLTEHHLCGSRV